MTHDLKTWPEYFLQVVCGRKTFEIRKNDRDFKSHDILHLREWNPETKEYTGQACSFKVTYILDLTDFGLENHMAMAIVPWFPPSSTQKNKSDMPDVMPLVCEHEWHHIGDMQGHKVMQCVKCDKGEIAH